MLIAVGERFVVSQLGLQAVVLNFFGVTKCSENTVIVV